MEYKVSVVVPIYGTEKYIERCARSLFEQTLDSIEYIFVNDCTKDSSITVLRKVIEDYPNRKDQIKLINLEENKGLAIARGTGIRHCNGKYITTCDSDDWVEADAYESMVQLAEKQNADVVICDFNIANDNIKKIAPILHPIERLTWISDMLYHKTSWSIWNKMFRSSLYQNSITFPKYSMGEDCAFVLQLAYFCNKIAYTHKASYNYYYNSSSIVNKKNSDSRYKRFIEGLDNNHIVENFYKNKREYPLLKGGINNMIYQTKCLLLPLIYNEKYKRIWGKTYPGIEWKILCDKKNPMKERIRSFFILTKIYPRITNLLGLTTCK